MVVHCTVGPQATKQTAAAPRASVVERAAGACESLCCPMEVAEREKKVEDEKEVGVECLCYCYANQRGDWEELLRWGVVAGVGVEVGVKESWMLPGTGYLTLIVFSGVKKA